MAKKKSAKKSKSAKPAAKKKVSPVPKGYHTATPYLVCRGAADAIEFYKKAFGAKEILRMPRPDGMWPTPRSDRRFDRDARRRECPRRARPRRQTVGGTHRDSSSTRRTSTRRSRRPSPPAPRPRCRRWTCSGATATRSRRSIRPQVDDGDAHRGPHAEGNGEPRRGSHGADGGGRRQAVAKFEVQSSKCEVRRVTQSG